MTDTAVIEQINNTSFEDALCHVVPYCSDDIALCGKNVSEDEWVEESTNECIVCIDLERQQFCPRCKRPSVICDNS